MEKMPTSANQPSQRHSALIWLIRGTGAIIVILSAIQVAFLLLVLIIPFHPPQTQDWLMALFLLLLGMMFGVFFLMGYSMWRRVDKTSVAIFAFIFSFMTARAFYHLLPSNLPKILADHVGPNSPFLGQGTDPGISYRGTLAFGAFLIFYVLVQECLNRMLGLQPPDRPQPPPGPPEPFVPFDPYDLSKNHPLHPL